MEVHSYEMFREADPEPQDWQEFAARHGAIMTVVDGCVFCEILADRLPASVVLRDRGCTAFMDIQPINAGHVLVVPDDHAAYLANLPEDTGAQMFRTARKVATALYESGLDCEGINLFLADGGGTGSLPRPPARLAALRWGRLRPEARAWIRGETRQG